MTSAPAYFDTSALVKLYVREAHSESTAALFLESASVAVHEIGFVELHAALAAACRIGRLAEAEQGRCVTSFRKDWASGITTVKTDEELLERAAELAEGFALRGYDAFHLASAERIRLHLPQTRFLSFDRQLNRAAKLLGFTLPDFVPRG